jgi:hypothetical protein
MPQDPWLGWVEVPPEVETKLRIDHFLTPTQVRQAICWGAHDKATWDDHPGYGERLVVTGSTQETGPIIIYLKPLDESDGTLGMQDSLEAVMDKELEEDLKLTKEDLLHKLETGRPANLRRVAPRDPNQRAKMVMDVVTAKSEREIPTIVVGPRLKVSDFRPISDLTDREVRQSDTALHTVRQ